MNLSSDFSIDESFQEIMKEQYKLKEKYGRYVKAGRWIYCKYCYANRIPIIDWSDGLIKCGTCDAGLVPLQDEHTIKLWIIGKWFDYLEIEFILQNLKYDLGKKQKTFYKNKTDEQLRKTIDEGNEYLKEIEKELADWRGMNQ
jgi:hypothetical protein